MLEREKHMERRYDALFHTSSGIGRIIFTLKTNSNASFSLERKSTYRVNMIAWYFTIRINAICSVCKLITRIFEVIFSAICKSKTIEYIFLKTKWKFNLNKNKEFIRKIYRIGPVYEKNSKFQFQKTQENNNKKQRKFIIYEFYDSINRNYENHKWFKYK